MDKNDMAVKIAALKSQVCALAERRDDVVEL